MPVIDPMRRGSDVGPGALVGHSDAQGVAVVDSVGEQNLSGFQLAEHVGGSAAVMRLPLDQLDPDGQTVRVDQGVNLGGQAAA